MCSSLHWAWFRTSEEKLWCVLAWPAECISDLMHIPLFFSIKKKSMYTDQTVLFLRVWCIMRRMKTGTIPLEPSECPLWVKWTAFVLLSRKRLFPDSFKSACLVEMLIVMQLWFIEHFITYVRFLFCTQCFTFWLTFQPGEIFVDERTEALPSLSSREGVVLRSGLGLAP